MSEGLDCEAAGGLWSLQNQLDDWANVRNLIKGSTAQAQLVKLVEEVGELAGGIAKHRPDVVRDSIGDCIVVLSILATQSGLELSDCVKCAWDEIKDRRGRMVDGMFIKEGD